MNPTLQFELDCANNLIAEAPTKGEVITIRSRIIFDSYHLDAWSAKLITEFEFIDHGIDHAQYFPGCGTAFTDFDDVFTGCGSNPAEAVDDMLDELGSNGYETDGILEQILDELGLKELPETPSAHDDCHSIENCEIDDCEACRDHGGCDLYYYVSIRVKG